MNKIITTSIAVLSVALMTGGCATIVSGTTQKISVTSQPSHAIAKADNNMSAVTPTTFTLDRKSDHTIEISKDGFKTTTVMIKKTFNGMATGNILIGGIIGAGVDAASGSMNKLVPERIDIALEEGQGYSDKPKFVSAKDQEFYENSILRAGASEQKKHEQQALASAPKTNFSKK